MTASAIAFPDITRQPPSSAPLQRVLLATAGADCADGACRVAVDLLARTGATIKVLTVWGHRGSTPSAALHQLRRLGLQPDPAYEWIVAKGVPAAAITEAARRSAVDLIVVGTGRPGGSRLCLETETALRIARQSAVPVYCAEPGAAFGPRRILCALDGSPASVRAARFGLAAIGHECACVTYVQVGAPSSARFDLAELVRARIPTPAHIDPTLMVHQRPLTADEVLVAAEDVGADLITTAYQTVSARALRAGRWSVLIARDHTGSSR